jgi:CheY-like chemotaxis protein
MGLRQSRLYGEEMPQILAIDDDEVSRKLIRGNLSDIARVNTVVCGRDGLSYLNTWKKVDLILLDYRMPGMTGIEVLKQIKYLVKDCGMTLDGASKRLSKNRTDVETNMEIVSRLEGIKEMLVGIKNEM